MIDFFVVFFVCCVYLAGCLLPLVTDKQFFVEDKHKMVKRSHDRRQKILAKETKQKTICQENLSKEKSLNKHQRKYFLWF